MVFRWSWSVGERGICKSLLSTVQPITASYSIGELNTSDMEGIRSVTSTIPVSGSTLFVLTFGFGSSEPPDSTIVGVAAPSPPETQGIKICPGG